VVDRARVTNSFEFVVVAGARARQLMKGAVPRVTDPGKPITVAQREVLEGEVQKVDEQTPAQSVATRDPKP